MSRWGRGSWRRTRLPALAGVTALLAGSIVYVPPYTSSSASSAVVDAYAMGFDTCSSLSASTLRAWVYPNNGSPNLMIGLYLGGEDGAAVGCDDPISTFTTAINDGYGVESFWYGAQQPTSCGGTSGRPAYIAQGNSTTETQQGENEAASAYNQAAAAGFPQNGIIYLDLEGFVNNAGCLAAAQYYVNGFDYELYALGGRYHWGLYGSTCSSYLSSFAGITFVPMAIAPDDPGQSVKGVYGLVCLPDSYWNANQRVHQDENVWHATFGGIRLTIDEDCADGPLIGNRSWTFSSCLNPYGSPGA